MENLDLGKLLKLYSDGRITKKEFVYFHAVLSQQQKQARGKTPATIKVNLPKKRGNIISFVKTHHKSVITFIGSMWIFVSLAAPYWKDLRLPFYTPQAENVKQTLSEPPDKQTAKTIDYKKELKTVTEVLVKKPIWDSEAINKFINTWNKLSKGEISEIKKIAWYGEFIQKLEKQIKFESARREQNLDDRTVAYRQRALLRLAETLNFNTAKIKQTFAEARTRNIAKISEPITKSKSKTKSVESPKKKATSTKNKTATKSKAEKQLTKSIPDREIDKILRQYVTAFEKGNTRQITSLFADDKHLQRPLTLSGLRTQYQNLFRATDERWVEFRSVSWNKKSGRAIGRGTFRTSLRSIGSGEYKTQSTNVVITLRKSKNVARITDFELIDSSILSLAPVKRKARSNAQDSNYPSRSELQDIVTQYQDTYQSGDIKRLMTLFASSTWTADRTGLVELKKDYENLFSSTTDRQLFITNMNWDLKNRKAMGTGDLVINLISDDNSSIIKQKGKVRMVVEKVGKRARITHLFHIVN